MGGNVKETGARESETGGEASDGEKDGIVEFSAEERSAARGWKSAMRESDAAAAAVAEPLSVQSKPACWLEGEL